MNAEEGASIRAVRRVYAEQAGIPFDQSPEPKGSPKSAWKSIPATKPPHEAFRQLGEVVGDALGNALTLVDGLAVIGGGLSGAWPLFLPAVVAELNGTYTGPNGNPFAGWRPKRLTSMTRRRWNNSFGAKRAKSASRKARTP